MLVSEASILSESERQRVLVEWNRTDCPYPSDVGFHQLVERQAERTPGAVALDFEGQTWSYRELNARANQLARHLQTMGVRRGDLVGISLPRGPDIIRSILATWKAGAAYLFLDPEYPARRLADLLEDARPTALIAGSPLRTRSFRRSASVRRTTPSVGCRMPIWMFPSLPRTGPMSFTLQARPAGPRARCCIMAGCAISSSRSSGASLSSRATACCNSPRSTSMPRFSISP